ncbi:DUF433 domain-containing protein [Methylobacterium sp. WL116]|uniref:DUF433 domain-containing protein n=1 Tax=Methylobacterium sp. WL116 TaxID=2603889 RepID=UPI0011C7F00C|nr:DUF433 domain-containing protein [Methylobacterium sp. WL116]TXM93886.1 DUF433 domain-containing protein [Methylobacterium sp. WL116]
MPIREEPVVVRNSRILGGRPIFRGTRVQVEMLFENLAEGYSVDEIIESFPTLDKDDLRAVLLQACEALKRSAPDITPEHEPEAVAHARVLR